MRILIPTGAFPPEIGGPATYVPRLANALVKQGHLVTVMTLTPGGDFDDSGFNFRLVRLNAHGRVRRWMRTVWTIARELRQHDAVYINGLLLETAVATMFVNRPKVAKVVGDIAWERARDKGWLTHTIDFFQTRVYGLSIETRRSMRDWALHRMDQIIVPSHYLYKIVANWFVDPRLIKVIYNAYEPPLDQQIELEIPLKNEYRLVTVCRLVNWKGVDGIISILPNLPDCDLLIIGDGPEYQNLVAQTAELNLTHRIHFTGNLSHASVMAALKTADLFVLNSVYEGLPHVLLEALAAGLPIVATNIGGTPEVVINGQNGCLVPIYSPSKLQASIRDSLNHLNEFNVELPPQFRLETMIEKTIQLLIETGNQGR